MFSSIHFLDSTGDFFHPAEQVLTTSTSDAPLWSSEFWKACLMAFFVRAILAVLLTATIISFTGVIGFVGLIAPHIARFTIGNEHNFLFPMTAAVGAILLVLADTLGKYVLYPVNVPVGIVVSFIGVPIFIHLIISSRRGGV